MDRSELLTSNDQNPRVWVAGTYVLTVTGANGCSRAPKAEVDTDEKPPVQQQPVVR
ncbi:MAG: hypothetical protein IPI81_07660 [Flavobacteriales bacterium]|nr:hypothetical protein [Flavobacteriales bacterium]